MKEVVGKIEQWAHDRNLIAGATNMHAQMTKLTEEVGEIAAGIARDNKEAIKDGIGDAVVVLTIMAQQHGFSIEECAAAAYETIKDRKGRMENGVFIKENDPQEGKVPLVAEDQVRHPEQGLEGVEESDEGDELEIEDEDEDDLEEEEEEESEGSSR